MMYEENDLIFDFYKKKIKLEFVINPVSKNAKMQKCTSRESNPGRPRGRRAFYH